MQNEIELRFDGITVTLTTEEPAAVFRVAKALQNDGRELEFRHFDEEIDDKTCWQPFKRAA